MVGQIWITQVQVNLCQKLLFLHQLTHNMTTDCSLKIPSRNLGRTCCVQKLFLTFRTIFVHNMFSPCSAKRRASDKDLPVKGSISAIFVSFFLLRKNYPNTYYFTTRKLNALKCQKLFTRRTSTLNLVFFSKKNLTL